MENLHQKNIIVTGPAGTGKSTHLKSLVKELKSLGRRVQVCSPTGLAALNVDGTTLHSFFGIHPGGGYRLSQDDKLNIKNLDTIIIDEFSMMGLSLFDQVSDILKKIMESDEVFGGKQVIMYGDILQIPPVKDLFFFQSTQFSLDDFEVIYLQEVKRQKTDQCFIQILNRIRKGEASVEDVSFLNTLKMVQLDGLTLYPSRADVHSKNMEKLRELDGEEITFQSCDHRGSHYSLTNLFKNCLTPQVLKLKVGASLMCTVNDPDGNFVNGTQGKLISFTSKYLTVELNNKEKIKIGRYNFSNNSKSYPCSFKQFPVVLAYALTTHKSQGMTLDKLNVDFKGFFNTNSMVYVALSRVKSSKQICIHGLNPDYIRCDPKALEFDKELLWRSSNASAV